MSEANGRKPSSKLRGISPDVLSRMAHEALETKLAERGFVSNAEEAFEEHDPYPNRIDDLPEAGFYVQLAPDEKWADEFRRWNRHFQLLGDTRLPYLGFLYDSASHTLRIFDCSNFNGGIRVC